MKSFKTFILERRKQNPLAPQWTKSASEHIFSGGIRLPLGTKMIKRVLGKLPRMTVFHVTNRAFLDDMIKLQGKKKSISAATGFDSSVINSGINVSGGLVFELDADVLISAPRDIMSRPDKTGRRWVDLDDLLPIRGNLASENMKLHQKIKADSAKLLLAIMKKHMGAKGINNDPDSIIVNWSERRWLGNVISSEEMSEKEIGTLYQTIVREYIDAMEKVIRINSTSIRDAFFNHALSVKGTTLGGAPWDELVVNNTKIKSILIDKTSTMRSFNFDITNQGFVDDDEIEPRYNAWLADLDRRRIPYEVFSNHRQVAAAVMQKRNK
jgi:hypothetical protein